MRLILTLLVAAMLLLSACASHPQKNASASQTVEQDETGRTLRLDGESVLLGEAASRPMSREMFARRISQLVSNGQNDAAFQLVRTYPDLARETVFASDQTPLTTRLAIATWLDALAQPQPGGWVLFVTDQKENPSRYAPYNRARASVWPALRRGAFAEVAALPLNPPTDAPVPWAQIDAMLLRATVLLAAGRPAEATPLFDQASQLAADWDWRVALRAKLFAALSDDLAGDPQAARTHYQSAMQGIALNEIDDPMILQLILKTQPDSASGMTRPTRRSVLAALGQLEMRRGAPQAALLSWRTAESQAGSEPSNEQLQLQQAEALIALQQEDAAMAMLTGLAQAGQPASVRPQALVILGLIQMKRNEVEVALAMFKEAATISTPESHPSVHADIGLAFLSLGQAQSGLSRLDQARKAYQARGDDQAVQQLLQNQLRYANAVGDATLAQETRQALSIIRQSP